MTKEEVIKDLIDMAKNGANNPLDAYCDSCSCLTCPFHSDENGECPDELVGELIGRLIKAEEKKETNFDHYVSDYWIYRDGYQVIFNLRSGWKESLSDFGDGTDIMKWFKLPYEEQKPRYKLSKFEHDLLDSYFDKKYGIKNSFMLDTMRKKGYFKGVPTDMPIKDVLDNCEVIEE